MGLLGMEEAQKAYKVKTQNNKGRWMEWVQISAQWWALVLIALASWVVVSVSLFCKSN
jgi:hypothetical protein